MRQDSPETHNAPFGAQINFGAGPWILMFAAILSSLGFLMGLIALVNTSGVGEAMGRAVAKAETATARANTAEIYAYQVYTELNRLGYPVRTPAEDHVPQPPNTPPEVDP
jgi:hypothetical protein